MCKVRGELVWSAFLGWDNKAHDGYLGHAMLGRWVNLGAGTITSNLKNTYGPIRLEHPTGRLETGSPVHAERILLDVIGATVIGVVSTPEKAALIKEHGADHALGVQGEHDGIEFRLVAADAVGFAPVLLTV